LSSRAISSSPASDVICRYDLVMVVVGLLGFWDLGEGDIVPMEGDIPP
jgi:hypothetical protein